MHAYLFISRSSGGFPFLLHSCHRSRKHKHKNKREERREKREERREKREASALPCRRISFFISCLGRLLSRTCISIIRQVQMPDCALPRQHDHPDDTARATVPLDGLLQRLLDELDALVLAHVVLPVRIAEAVDVRRSGSADRIGLLVQRAAEWDTVDGATGSFVVSGKNYSCTVVGEKKISIGREVGRCSLPECWFYPFEPLPPPPDLPRSQLPNLTCLQEKGKKENRPRDGETLLTSNYPCWHNTALETILPQP
jgi:hypothetical protein